MVLGCVGDVRVQQPDGGGVGLGVGWDGGGVGGVVGHGEFEEEDLACACEALCWGSRGEYVCYDSLEGDGVERTRGKKGV